MTARHGGIVVVDVGLNFRSPGLLAIDFKARCFEAWMEFQCILWNIE